MLRTMGKWLVWAGMALLSAGSLCPALELGRVVYIGDSITQGVGAPSYRWALHKILVDNGVAYEELGVEQGNRLPEFGVAPGTLYRGVPFRNLHCAMTGEQAAEISGRLRCPERLDGTGLADWLGQTASLGSRRLPAAPDTAFILVGTNDLLGELGEEMDDLEKLAEGAAALLEDDTGDMSRIAAALRRANPQVRLVVIEVPTWAYFKRNNRPSAFAALAEYNAALRCWAQRHGALFVPLNHVLADPAQSVQTPRGTAPGRGIRSFFCEEPNMLLHPTRQGDLLIAGMVARALGVPGRLAGVVQGLGADSAEGRETVVAAGERLCEETLSSAAVVRLPVTEGEEGCFSLSLGDGVRSGRLRVCRGVVIWGDDKTLIPLCSSGAHETLAVAWLDGDAEQGIAAGYYVWLGDMLVGEALPAEAAEMSGFCAENQMSGAAHIRYFSSPLPAACSRDGKRECRP